MPTVTDTVLQGLETFPNASTTPVGLAVIIAGMLYKYMTTPSKLVLIIQMMKKNRIGLDMTGCVLNINRY